MLGLANVACLLHAEQLRLQQVFKYQYNRYRTVCLDVGVSPATEEEFREAQETTKRVQTKYSARKQKERALYNASRKYVEYVDACSLVGVQPIDQKHFGLTQRD